MGRAEDIQHTIMVGTIAQMPAEDQAKVQEHAAKFREMVSENGGRFNKEHAVIAFALVGCEMAKEAD